MTRIQGLLLWALGSSVLMLVGSIGPWATVAGVTVAGTDWSPDGWIVIGATLVPGFLFVLFRTQWWAGLFLLIGGLVGAGTTIYDRQHLASAISSSGTLGHLIAQVGWGLTLAMIASVSVTVSGLVWLVVCPAHDRTALGRLKVVSQALALCAVAGLLSLLVWRVAKGSGQTATPANFTLSRLDRPGTLSLASLRGKVVVLNFWASWCIPCKAESPRFEVAWKRYRAQGLVVVGIDANDFSSDARKFAARYHLTYPLLHDGSGKTLGPYGVTGFPETRFIDRRGRFVGDHVIGEISSSKLEKNIAKALRS